MYLYDICSDFYHKMMEYYCKKEDLLFPLNREEIIKKDTFRIVYNVLNGQGNYFKDFNDFFTNLLFDLDYISSIMEDVMYIDIPLSKNKNGDYQCISNYQTEYREKLTRIVYETMIIRTVLRHIIMKFRSYYKKDFMKNNCVYGDNQGTLFKDIYRHLANTHLKADIKHYNTYEEILENVASKKMELLDQIYMITDNNSFNDEVINQQRYYLQELDELTKEIEKKGNITNLPSEVFNMYLDFFKEMVNKINIRIQELSKWSLKK